MLRRNIYSILAEWGSTYLSVTGLIWLHIMFLRLISAATYGKLSYSKVEWNSTACACGSVVVSLFIPHLWTLRLFPSLGCCENGSVSYSNSQMWFLGLWVGSHVSWSLLRVSEIRGEKTSQTSSVQHACSELYYTIESEL